MERLHRELRQAELDAWRTRYEDAANNTGYGAIWLLRTGEMALVRIVINGEWVTALECALTGLIKGRHVTRRYKHAGYGAIGLDVDADFVRVLIKTKGRPGWVEAIRERRDGSFSRHISKFGILAVVAPDFNGLSGVQDVK